MTVSVIIAVKTWGKHLEECIDNCRRIDYPDFEIIVLPDSGDIPSGQDLMIIPTGPVSPGKKRDIAAAEAKGDILAFIDDDAYPHRDWLKAAVSHFLDPEVAAVGGPGVTPEDDSFLAKASGMVYSSPLVSGRFNYRYLPKSQTEVDDYPSCNFLIRKSVFLAAGGFNTDFWPGEDTKLCLEVAKRMHKKIIYDPQVLVFHHRRPLFLPHLRQIGSYALHRGFFVKRFPQTSRKPVFFIPSLFFAWVIFGALAALLSPQARQVYLFSLLFYILTVLIFSTRRGILSAMPVFAGIILTHFVYGFNFICGLFSGRLKDAQ